MKSAIRSVLVSLLILFMLGASSALAETVGVILSSGVSYYEQIHNALTDELARVGYSGRVKFIIQRPASNPISWGNAARKLIASDVDAIVVYGYGPTAAVLRERPDIPIIYAGSFMQVSAKKANVTGMYLKIPVLSVLRYLRASTSIGRLGVFYCSAEEDSVAQLMEIKASASKYGYSVDALDLMSAADISSFIATHSQSDAIFMTSSSVVNAAFNSILNFARNKKIPVGALMTFKDNGALVTLCGAPKEQGAGAASKLIEVLNGKKASNIPPTQGKDIELVFNMKEAREIGLKIPMELITEATRIIH